MKDEAFGGKARYNRSSPSSYNGCVARIIAAYVTPLGDKPLRILDVGGTSWGFRAHAALPPNCELMIVNPEPGTGAGYKHVEDLPQKAVPFDFAMMFGVMMYMDDKKLVDLFGEIRQRMRGQGIFLVAEPNPLRVWGGIEAMVKGILSTTGLMPRLYAYTPNKAIELLKQGGFRTFLRRDDLVPTIAGFAIDPMYYVIAASV